MTNLEYWAERILLLEEKLHSYGTDTYAIAEPLFQQAQGEIQKEIEVWLGRIATNNGLLSSAEARALLNEDQLAEFHWSVEEYIKYGNENALNQSWMKELENASAKFHVTKLEALQVSTQQSLEKVFAKEYRLVEDLTKKTYTNGFYGNTFEIQKKMGVAWDLGGIDQSKLDSILSNPWATDGRNFSDRIWRDKTQMVNALHEELFRLTVLGESRDTAIKSMTSFLQEQFSHKKGARYCAKRLIYTETAFFAAQAQRDSYLEMGFEEYEIVAVLDSKTSDVCQAMDRQHFQVADFKSGVTAPPFHPFCRSTTVAYFPEDWANQGKRLATDEEGEQYYVPESMDYAQWKETFVEGGSKEGLQGVENGGIMELVDTSDSRGALVSSSKEAMLHAENYYNLVRSMTTDCLKIATHTGVDLVLIEKAKNHLFLSKHDLGEKELSYFFPDYDIAQSWQRMALNTEGILPHDLVLLFHEQEEAKLMEQGLSQAEAHNKANEKYNYQQALNESR